MLCSFKYFHGLAYIQNVSFRQSWDNKADLVLYRTNAAYNGVAALFQNDLLYELEWFRKVHFGLNPSARKKFAAGRRDVQIVRRTSDVRLRIPGH